MRFGLIGDVHAEDERLAVALDTFERGTGKAALLVVNAGTLAREYDSGFSILDTVARRVDRYGFDAELRVSLVSRETV